jgi:hypothetical protein
MNGSFTVHVHDDHTVSTAGVRNDPDWPRAPHRPMSVGTIWFGQSAES